MFQVWLCLGCEDWQLELSMFAGTYSNIRQEGNGLVEDKYLTLSTESSIGWDWYTIRGKKVAEAPGDMAGLPVRSIYDNDLHFSTIPRTHDCVSVVSQQERECAARQTVSLTNKNQLWIFEKLKFFQIFKIFWNLDPARIRVRAIARVNARCYRWRVCLLHPHFEMMGWTDSHHWFHTPW